MPARLSASAIGAALAFCAPALCATLAAGAQAATVSSITPSFSPNRLGAPTAFTLAIKYTNTQGGVPAPVSHTVVHLPAGLGINLRGVGTCSKSRLQAQGPRGCPSSARVGAGSALLGAHLGSQTIDESATLTAFRGPNQGGRPVLEIFGQGLSPLEERMVITGVLQPDRPPYGMQLVMSIGAIPTLPTEPNASTIRFSLTIGGRSHARGLVRVPRSCPTAGFLFGADFTFSDGSTSNVTAPVHCP